jgi:class 3 adenylate cyclase
MLMEAPPLERKLTAIFAADVAGYSRLMEADEEGTLATLSAHRLVVDETIVRHRGRIAGTAGDSVLAEFPSVLDAVHASVEIQNALAEANAALPDDRRMEFRIGINIGDVMVKDGDIFGDGVNIAARLETLAEPGKICVSRGVRDHIRHKIAVAFDDLGEQQVKNIARPIRVFQLRLHGGPADSIEEPEEAPPPEPPRTDEVEIEFWDSIKHSTSPLEYRVYLERYPEGAFAPLAQARLAAMAEGQVGFAAPGTGVDPAAIELAFWDSVKDSENAEMFHAYLEKYPRGEFALLAEAKLAELGATR